MTRTAISPRLATKTLSNTLVWLADMGPPGEVPLDGLPPIERRPGPAGTRFHQIWLTSATGSTNADLLGLVRSGQAVDGAVLVTDHQTAGRGRQGRTWHDRPAGSLLASVLVRAEPSWAPLVPLATGLAASEAVAATAGVTVRLKWPNDVLVPAAGERKLAGILAEATVAEDGLWVVVGMGCNLSWPSDRPGELADRLVTLSDVGPAPGRDELLEVWLGALDRRLDELTTLEGRRALLADYRAVCVSLGRRVRLDTPSGPVEGVVEGVADDGGLMVVVDGELRRFGAGDVHHL
jgi:BirA family transcriptional regulator, biotin operon repressor / biotin---[acetyl-CoA-carboxylase] ligase